VWSPGLFAAGFEGDGGFHRDGRNPQAMDAWGIGGKDRAKDAGGAEPGKRSAFVRAKAAVKNGEIEATGQAGDDGFHLIEHAMNFLGGLAAESLRHAGGGGEVADVVVEGLR